MQDAFKNGNVKNSRKRCTPFWYQVHLSFGKKLELYQDSWCNVHHCSQNTFSIVRLFYQDMQPGVNDWHKYIFALLGLLVPFPWCCCMSLGRQRWGLSSRIWHTHRETLALHLVTSPLNESWSHLHQLQCIFLLDVMPPPQPQQVISSICEWRDKKLFDYDDMFLWGTEYCGRRCSAMSLTQPAENELEWNDSFKERSYIIWSRNLVPLWPMQQ